MDVLDQLEEMKREARETGARISSELEDLRAVGDTLQSSASRLAEWVLEQIPPEGAVPYEVHMAALEAETARDKWTEIRRRSRA